MKHPGAAFAVLAALAGACVGPPEPTASGRRWDGELEGFRGGRVRMPPGGQAPSAARSTALIDGQKKPVRRWAFVLVDIDGGGNPINKANAQDVLFNPDRPDSIRSYFREVSYGVQDLEGQVMGPIPYQMGGRCDTDRLASALVPQIQGSYDQYLWFFGKQQAACNWAGIGQVGTADRPGRHTWYNSFHSCTVLVQEPGHNFGMMHSSAMRCTRAGQPVPIAWPDEMGADCKHVEYGNPFDPMGGGDCFHMNGLQKAYQDWLGGCNVIKATSSGTFTIYPLESACDGPQLLQIPFAKPQAFGGAGVLTSYFLELRTPTGYRDRRLQPQVLVMVSTDVREARRRGTYNWLLDMTPETPDPRDSALAVGKRYEETMPGGPKFTVLSADATKAVIQVEIAGQPAAMDKPGQAVCDDLKPFDQAAAVRCVAPPTPAAPPPADGGAGDAGIPLPVDGGDPPGMGTPVPADAGAAPNPGGSPAPPTGTDAGRGTPPPARDPAPPTSSGAAPRGCQMAPVGAAAGSTVPALPLLFAWWAARRRRQSRGQRLSGARSSPS